MRKATLARLANLKNAAIGAALLAPVAAFAAEGDGTTVDTSAVIDQLAAALPLAKVATVVGSICVGGIGIVVLFKCYSLITKAFNKA